MRSIPTSWNISQGKQSRSNEVAVSQGELKRIVKLKLSSNFGTKWSRLRLRISRGNSYELNNQSLLD